MLPASLLVIKDSSRGRQHNVAELPRWQEVVDPLFNVTHLQVETRRDDATLVDAAIELHNNFATAVIVHYFELANVAYTQSNWVRK